MGDILPRTEAGNLPAEVTNFFGRRADIGEVKRLLTDSRLVTLTGVGGVGKTRLALRVATQLRRAFPDGVWLVELAGLHDPELLPYTVAEVLRLRDHSAGTPGQGITDFLHSRKALIVLDNCEHLRDACAKLAASLLRSAEAVRLLATSRETLRVDGERVYQVLPLPTPDPSGPLPSGSSEQYAAVALFADRAAAVLPSFAVLPENHRHVVQVCHELDGLPLAIELAAGRLRTLSLPQLCQRLDDRFRLLSAGSRAALPRHQTLTSAVEWSYQLCTPAERLLWQRVSVFAGSFDLSAAQAVCCTEEDVAVHCGDIFELVAGLVEKSVLVRTDSGSDAVARYRLLETLRQYGLGQLQSVGAEQATRHRHRDFYESLVHGHEAQWFGGRQIEIFRRTQAEHDNLRAALEFCLATPGEIGAAQMIGSALYFYWVACGYSAEGRYWLGRILAADVTPTPARAAALWTAAYICVIQGDANSAADLLEECRSLTHAFGVEHLKSRIGYLEGALALVQDDAARTVELLSRRWDEHLADGEQSIFTMLIGVTLASALTFCNDHTGSAVLAEQVVLLCEAQGDLWLKSYALYALSTAESASNQPDVAIAHAREAIKLKAAFQDFFGLALVVETLAMAVAPTGDSIEAAVLFGAGSRIWQMAGGQARLGAAIWNDPHDQCVRELQRAIGVTAYEAAFARGAALTIDEAVAHISGETPAVSKSENPSEPSGLTKREREVAALVAEGMTNRQIADRLVIAQRTAEAHVERVLAKLGFTSRAQIAAWITTAASRDAATGPGSGRQGHSPGRRHTAESAWVRGK